MGACGGGGGRRPPPPTGTLTATVVDEFGAPVAGADVAATVGGATRTRFDGRRRRRHGRESRDRSGERRNLARYIPDADGHRHDPGGTDDLGRRGAGAQHAGCRRRIHHQRHRYAVRERQGAHDRAAGRRRRPALASDRYADRGRFCPAGLHTVEPRYKPSAAECIRFTEDAQADHAYTVENPSAAAFALVPGRPPRITPRRSCSTRAAASRDRPDQRAPVLGQGFYADRRRRQRRFGAVDGIRERRPNGVDPDNTALVRRGIHVGRALVFRRALDALGTQADGGTPLYRGLFPEATDPANEAGFTEGLIDYVEANSPAGLRKAIVIFTDGEDKECASLYLSCEARPRDRPCQRCRCQPVYDRTLDPNRLRGAG